MKDLTNRRQIDLDQSAGKTVTAILPNTYGTGRLILFDDNCYAVVAAIGFGDAELDTLYGYCRRDYDVEDLIKIGALSYAILAEEEEAKNREAASVAEACRQAEYEKFLKLKAQFEPDSGTSVPKSQ